MSCTILVFGWNKIRISLHTIFFTCKICRMSVLIGRTIFSLVKKSRMSLLIGWRFLTQKCNTCSNTKYSVSLYSGVSNSIIGGGGAHIHIFEFTDHENNRFQTKLTVQNMNLWICAPPPQLLSLLRHCLYTHLYTHIINNLFHGWFACTIFIIHSL